MRLIQTVQQSLGIPVHHYIEMDFVGFLQLVDAVGGVVIDFDAPAFDDNSGLDIKTAGPHKLDRDQALAYVRSRHYTRIIDGKKVVDPTADLGRIDRQQEFFRAVMSKVGDTRNPLTLLRIADGVAAGLHTDDAMSFRDMIGLARKMGGLNPETVELPVKPTTTAGGAAVLLLSEPARRRPSTARVRGPPLRPRRSGHCPRLRETAPPSDAGMDSRQMSDDTTTAGPRPLEGLRVIDMTGEWGALCGRLLGDFGADVVLVEPPGARRRGRYRLMPTTGRASGSSIATSTSAASCSTSTTRPTAGDCSPSCATPMCSSSRHRWVRWRRSGYHRSHCPNCSRGSSSVRSRRSARPAPTRITSRPTTWCSRSRAGSRPLASRRSRHC